MNTNILMAVDKDFDMGSRWTFLIILIPIFVALIHLIVTFAIARFPIQSSEDKDEKLNAFVRLSLISILWSILINIPIMAILFLNTANLWHTGIFVYLSIFINAFIFGFVTKLRIYKGCANMLECQIVHFMQITVIWLFTVIMFLN